MDSFIEELGPTPETRLAKIQQAAAQLVSATSSDGVSGFEGVASGGALDRIVRAVNDRSRGLTPFEATVLTQAASRT